MTSTLFFDEARNKLFITFNYQLTVIEMKPEIKDRVMSHDKPVVAAVYNSTYNQVSLDDIESNLFITWHLIFLQIAHFECEIWSIPCEII